MVITIIINFFLVLRKPFNYSQITLTLGFERGGVKNKCNKMIMRLIGNNCKFIGSN